MASVEASVRTSVKTSVKSNKKAPRAGRNKKKWDSVRWRDRGEEGWLCMLQGWEEKRVREVSVVRSWRAWHLVNQEPFQDDEDDLTRKQWIYLTNWKDEEWFNDDDSTGKRKKNLTIKTGKVTNIKLTETYQRRSSRRTWRLTENSTNRANEEDPTMKYNIKNLTIKAEKKINEQS